MNKRKLIGNTVLALSLLAAGASFAEVTGSTPPLKRTAEERVALRAEMKEKMQNMTPEQRAEMKSQAMEHRAEHMKHRAEHMEQRAERLEQRAAK
jgi:hypothetical protein